MVKIITLENNLKPTINSKQKEGKFKGVNFSFDDLVKNVLQNKKRKEKQKENTGETMHHYVALEERLQQKTRDAHKGLNLKTLENLNPQSSVVQEKKALAGVNETVSIHVTKGKENTGETRFALLDTVTKSISQEKQVASSIKEKINAIAGKTKEAGNTKFSPLDAVIKNTSQEKQVASSKFENVGNVARNTKESRETSVFMRNIVMEATSQKNEVNEKAPTDTKFSPLDTVIKNTSQEKQVASSKFEKVGNVVANTKETGETKDFSIDAAVKKVFREKQEISIPKENENVLPNFFKVNSKVERIQENTFSLPRATFQNIMQDIVQKIKLLVSENKSFLELQLKPGFLGKVKILLHLYEGLLTARIVAESNQTANLLNNNLQQVKQSLEEQGVKVEYFSVDVGSGQEGYKGESNNQNQKGLNYHTPRQSKYFESATVPQEEEQNLKLDGRLNILA